MHFNFTIEGNLAADPEFRVTPNGTAVAQLRLAHSNRYQRDGKWVEGSTLWINVACWRGLAERVAESLSKGDTVLVELANDLRAESYNGNGYLRATARNVSLSMRFAGASSDRAARTPDSAGLQEVPASGGYDTGADAGYQPTDTTGGQAASDAEGQTSTAGEATSVKTAQRPSRPRKEPVKA